MAEPTCVMPSFSCTPQENENPMYGLGDSISFGRYLTEDLSWERWSTFNDNNNRKRYVEEAEKYSRPGSVAQKKAYFEAHFKRVAALKASSLEEEDGVQEIAKFEGEVSNGENGHEFSSCGQNLVYNSVNERVQNINDETNKVIVVEKHENGDSSVDDKHAKEERKDDLTKENAPLEQVEKNLANAKDENCNGIKEDSTRTTQMVTSPLQVSVNGIAESSPSNTNLAKRGEISHLDSVQPRQNNLSSEFKLANTGKNKSSSRIIPSCFCWSHRDRTARRKQEKEKTRYNKFRLSFCFKATPSTD